LALSEKTRGSTYHERLSLAAMYNMDFSCDACRVTALFGSEQKSNRESAIATREIVTTLTKKNTLNDLIFVNYDSEIDSSELWDKIRYFTTEQKVQLWNDSYPFLKIEEQNDEDSKEVFDNLTTAYFHDFILKAKHVLFTLFTLPKHYPSYEIKRTEAIIQCFCDGGDSVGE
jgi:hypothetical protein